MTSEESAFHSTGSHRSWLNSHYQFHLDHQDVQCLELQTYSIDYYQQEDWSSKNEKLEANLRNKFILHQFGHVKHFSFRILAYVQSNFDPAITRASSGLLKGFVVAVETRLSSPMPILGALPRFSTGSYISGCQCPHHSSHKDQIIHCTVLYVVTLSSLRVLLCSRCVHHWSSLLPCAHWCHFLKRTCHFYSYE